MGSFVFKWDHAATEVYVTGTFDDWARSVKLDQKDGNRFEKLVELPQGDENIYYKFVVDGEWTTDPTAPQESDGASNINNVLTPEHIVKSQPASTAPDLGIMSNVTPQSTTAKLAGDVPKESSRDQASKSDFGITSNVTPQSTTAKLAGNVPKESSRDQASDSDLGITSNVTPQSTTAKLAGNVSKESSRDQASNPGSAGLPGSFPETPAQEPSSFSVDPIPATSGIGNPIHLRPGEKVPDPSTFTSNTISSTVRDDPTLARTTQDSQASTHEPSTFSVNPIPATSGIGNPINLRPGEKVPDPSTLTSNTISSTARDDPTLAETAQDRQGPTKEASTFSVNPIPATSGIGNPVNLRPGEKVPDPSTLTPNTISSTVRDDPSLEDPTQGSQQTFGVSPLPATSGIGNPIQIRPGEKLPDPSTFTQNTINSTVTTDKDSYENGSGAPQLPNVVTPQKERDASGYGMFGLPPVSGTMIPESSLPMGTSFDRDPGVTIQSAGPNSTTAALAGQVPLEPRSVPKSADKSLGHDSDPTIQSVGEDSSTAALAGQVPLEPRSVPKGADKSLGHDSDPTIQSVGDGSSTAALAGQVPLEPRSVPKGSSTSSGQGPDVTIQSVGPNSTTTGLAGQVPLESRGVPEVVQESQHEADFPPEASANSEAVREKFAVEEELESKIREEPPTSEGVGGQTASGAANHLKSGNSTAGSTSLPSRGIPDSVQQSIDDINKGTPIAATVPDVVQDSIRATHLSPEAAGSKIKVDEKYQVEKELLAEVKEDAAGEPAPSLSAGLIASAPSATNAASTKATSAASPATRPVEQASSHPRLDSRDISPMSHPVKPPQTQPTVTTGVGSSTAPQTSQPAASTPQKEVQPTSSSSSSKPAQTTTSASASTDKKSKRASGFFGKLKQKFSDKDKDKKSS
ncbi:hypothetical protein MMC07_003506 [Pseudocyphellaria aurata]|nr:hypothetical protein [Pseudocyphellaria aurata]